MMQCQICGDTQGPFAFIDYKKRVVLACEKCEKKQKRIFKKKNKENIFNYPKEV